MKKNWAIYGADGVAITAGNASAVSVIGSDERTTQAEDVMIDNPGPLDVYVKASIKNDPVATVNSVRVPAGSLQPYMKGVGAKYLATYCPGGNQNITVHMGDGE